MTGEQKWWEPISHFLGHTVMGAVLFLIVAAVSVGLAFLVRFLGTLGTPAFTLWVLEALEHIILVGDVILYLVYMYVAAVKVYREAME